MNARQGLWLLIAGASRYTSGNPPNEHSLPFTHAPAEQLEQLCTPARRASKTALLDALSTIALPTSCTRVYLASNL